MSWFLVDRSNAPWQNSVVEQLKPLDADPVKTQITKWRLFENFDQFTRFSEPDICFSILVLRNAHTQKCVILQTVLERDHRPPLCDVTKVAYLNFQVGCCFRPPHLPEEAFLERGCKQRAKCATFCSASRLLERSHIRWNWTSKKQNKKNCVWAIYTHKTNSWNRIREQNLIFLCVDVWWRLTTVSDILFPLHIIRL